MNLILCGDIMFIDIINHLDVDFFADVYLGQPMFAVLGNLLDIISHQVRVFPKSCRYVTEVMHCD